MLMRLLVKILLGKKDTFIKAIKFNNKTYIVKVEKYESGTDMVNRLMPIWERGERGGPGTKD